MIVVTGAAGFIGSCLVKKLNEEQFYDLILVDDFSNPQKNKNLEGLKFSFHVHRNNFMDWIDKNHVRIQFVFHIGARTDTTETNTEIFRELNLEYSKNVWKKCVEYGLPLVYASSAATYGNGQFGYDDNHDVVEKLQPMNPYGVSKNEFDKWVLKQKRQPYFWAGLKFFNVYGPNEYHKGRMASVVWHSYNQLKNTGKIKLFRSHNPEFEDGKQMRDFIYVKDVIDVCYFLMHHRKNSDIYNVGTGKSQSFLDLANAVFYVTGIEKNIEFIDTPQDIRENYQYFTEAKIDKLKSIGYNKEFKNLKEGVFDYVKNYLEG